MKRGTTGAHQTDLDSQGELEEHSQPDISRKIMLSGKVDKRRWVFQAPWNLLSQQHNMKVSFYYRIVDRQNKHVPYPQIPSDLCCSGLSISGTGGSACSRRASSGPGYV